MLNSLKSAGIDNAFNESHWIFEKVFDRDIRFMSEVMLNSPAPAELVAQIEQMTAKRCENYPLQYLLEKWEFYGLEIIVGEGVLIPRPDTEILAEIAINHHCGSFPPTAADLCTGSGCIGIAVAKNTKCKVYGIDNSEKALEFAKRNITLHHIQDRMVAINADVMDADFVRTCPKFDMILSNPPYLTDNEMLTLQKEVTHEPTNALYGGKDGLDYYRRILALWCEKLIKGGLIAFETGDCQAREVAELMNLYGLKTSIHKDFNGIERVVAGTL